MEKLTRTFQDAINFTRGLEFSYIWIDSLCIVQDDEDDWFRESSLVSNVYGNAVVNLAATKAENGSHGLFCERDIITVDRKFIKSNSSNLYEIWDETLYERCLLHSPLSARGWCFQERFLVTRTLRFAAEQVMAECHSGVVCETHQDKFPRNFSFDSYLFPNDRNTVTLYSQTKLTFNKDKLVAFSGIAHHFEKLYPDQYIAGL
ncbi:hypothetical protein BDZ45DRAFT_651428 [Acephala macrosclerotiorum]|nr:hypothetical protein BDZ45DRAFT_651428 [Acephala macrosclerotiorum]